MTAAIVEAKKGEPVLRLQTFADESDRARLSAVALKAFLALMKAWGFVQRGGLGSSRGFREHA